MDDSVDILNEAVKLYVDSHYTPTFWIELVTAIAQVGEIISFSINLEHVGDIIDKNLMYPRVQEDQAWHHVLAGWRVRSRSSSPASRRHAEARAVSNIHVGRYIRRARRLIAAKKTTATREGIRRHCGCAVSVRVIARGGRPETIESIVLAESGHLARPLNTCPTRHLCSAAIPFWSARVHCSATVSEILALSRLPARRPPCPPPEQTPFAMN